jgi:uncharacterized protein (TIGR03435 family)
MPTRLLLFPALALAFASLLAQATTASATSGPATSAPAFILADVHPSPWTIHPYTIGDTLQGDRYTFRQATMVDLIANAYSLDPSVIRGGPSWLDFDRFDIVAQAPPGTPAPTLKLMLRGLLTDRFGLVTHNGTAPAPAWLLTAEKPKLAEAQSGTTECVGARSSIPGAPIVAIACHNMSMDQFAPTLLQLDRGYFYNKPVVDATGLSGSYDFQFQWTPSGSIFRAGSNGISLFDALQKQLGLKLDLQTAPRPVLLVDHVRRAPTPNPPGIEKTLPPELPAHFEVAVIKPNNYEEQPGGFTVRGCSDDMTDSLQHFIQAAWDLDLNQTDDVVGLPKWGASDHYDIQARASAEDLVQLPNGKRQIQLEQACQMLRQLLIERFGVEAHREERLGTGYNLESAGPKLKPANPSERTQCVWGPVPGEKDPRFANPILDDVFHCQNITLAEFGRQLPFFSLGMIFSPVLDDTGLQGRYDFTLSFTERDRPQSASSVTNASAPADPNGAISLSEAIRHQLGLKLEKVRRPVPVLVIDHINRLPSDN